MGPVGSAYLRVDASDIGSLCDQLHAELEANMDEVHATRRGRVWSVWKGGNPYYVDVLLTDAILWDCEDELLELELLPEDVPVRVIVAAGCNEPVDYAVCRRLLDLAAGLGDGVVGVVLK